jgi:hypothetical protein
MRNQASKTERELKQGCLLGPFFHWRVGLIIFAYKDLFWAEDAVVFQLFEPVGSPPSNPGNCKNRSEQIAGYTHALVYNP